MPSGETPRALRHAQKFLPRTGIRVMLEMSKGKTHPSRDSGKLASAPPRSPPRYWREPRRGGDSRQAIELPPELPRRIPHTGGLIVAKSHIPFWRRVKAQEGNKKDHSPAAEEMANYRKRLLTDSPTGPSFSTARRRGPKTSATLEKPLTRESLVHPDDIFRRRRAVACLPRGRLAYRGSMPIGRFSKPHAEPIQLQVIADFFGVSIRKR